MSAPTPPAYVSHFWRCVHEEMTSLDRKAAARDRAAGTVRPPGYELLSDETRAVAIETVAEKLRKEVAAATGLPEGVDLHVLEYLVVKPQLPTMEFLQLIEKQRKREYDDKFWDWRRREVDPYVEKVVAAVVQKVEQHVKTGCGGQRLGCFVDGIKAPTHPLGWYSFEEKKHVPILDLVKSALADIGFSMLAGVVPCGQSWASCVVAWGDSVAKQGAAGEPKAKRARGNARDSTEAGGGGLEAIGEIRRARDRVATEIVKSVKRLCLVKAADGYSHVDVDFFGETGRLVPVQGLRGEMMEKHTVDILDTDEMGDIWEKVVDSLHEQGYDVTGDWNVGQVLSIHF